MTLPLIYTLQNCDKETKRKIIYIVKNQNTDKQKVNEVIDIVRHSGGIEYAQKEMEKYQTEALQMLDRFPDSEAKHAMKELVNYVINRTH